MTAAANLARTNPPAPSAQANTTPLAVPPRQAGHLLSLSLSKIYGLMRTGELDSYSHGRTRRVTTASIHAYIARQLAGADSTDTRWQGAPPLRRGWQQASRERG